MSNRKAVDAQFADWLIKKATDGLDFNESLYSKRDFYNPSMVGKLLDYAGLKECQSNLPYMKSMTLPSFDYERVSMNQRREYEERKKH